MKFTRITSKAKAQHVDSSTPSHRRDKAAGDKRRTVAFVKIPAADRPSPRRSFPGVVGVEVIHDNATGKWVVCANKGDLGNHLVQEAAARTRYYATVRRRGRVEKMARNDPSPVFAHTVSFHPAQSDMLAALTARGEGRELPKKIMSHFVKLAMPLFAGRRYVLGAALHADTDDLHVDVAVARNGPEGRIGDAGMGLVGPWMTAVDRQIRSGAKISQTKLRQFNNAMANFQRREGADAIPFDIRLARAFDDAAAKVLGPGLQTYIGRYAEAVPGLEREQLLADLADVETRREALLQALNETSPELIRERALPRPAPEYATSASGSDRSGTGDVASHPVKAFDYGVLFEPVI